MHYAMKSLAIGPLKIAGALAILLSASNAYAQASTKYEYDAKGRLTVVSDNNKSVYYVLDNAGNRVQVSNTPPAPIPDPVITSFTAPTTVSGPSNVTVRWASANASYCTFAIFGDTSNHSYLPTVGDLRFYMVENTAVRIECYEGDKSAGTSKIIRIRSAGGRPRAIN